jgi:hypothetical protein
MMRCEEGHFYDAAKHSSCPWCSKGLSEELSGALVASAEAKTRPLGAAEAVPGMQPRAEGSAPAHGVTRRIDSQPSGVDPVVGWLVCIDGPEKGQDYRLHSERNFIGRAPSMDVCVAGDSSISREKHAVMIFEPRKKTFWLQPGEAAGLVYLNDEMLRTPTQVQPGDLVELGASKFVLTPFASERCPW